MTVRLFLLFTFSVVLCSPVYSQIVINEFMASNSSVLFDEDGDDPDWIELWNVGADSVSLSGWRLTDDPSNLTLWKLPNLSLASGEFLVIFASGKNRKTRNEPLHTNFTLAVEGEYLALVNPDGAIIDEFAPNYPNQDVWRGNVSYGMDASSQRVFFTQPTPGEINQGGVSEFLNAVSFSVERGFYEGPFTLELTAGPGADIYYTTNGDDPTPEDGALYDGPLHINQTTTLRASSYTDSGASSDVVSHTYIFLDDVLRQTRPAGYPTAWGGNQTGDYDMDPDVVNHPDYRATIKDDLKTIPSLSIVTDKDNLFDRRTGIYLWTDNKGVEWERPVSVEWIDPNGGLEFQVNCGLRIQGGYSRSAGNKKFSFRMLFKRDYGPPTLRFKVFPDSDVDKFDTLVLRGAYNYSWHSQEGGFGSNIGKAEYIRDQFSRQTQIDMGQPGAHGTYVHLYLNGMYWGLYNLTERPDDAFSAEAIGGEKEEWDVITGGTRGINQVQVKAGNKDGFDELMRMVARREYRTAQGYEKIQNYVNLDSLIDYMLCVFFAGNRDAPTVIGGGGRPWNYYSSYQRTKTVGFFYYIWDAEWSLEEPTVNVVEFHRGRDNPALVFQSLRELPEFRMYVADRIQMHFFNGGALTAENSIERYMALANQIDRAIVGESARWGDKRFNQPRLRDPHWTNEINRILQDYLPVRSDIVLEQLRVAELFPRTAAPTFSHRGGVIGSDVSLELASVVSQEFTFDTIVDADTEWKYNQSGVDLGDAWRKPGYDDSSWGSGQSLLYVENSDLSWPKNTPLRLGETTYYFRTTFNLDASSDLNEVGAVIAPFVDDGVIIYINGEEAFRIGMPNGDVTHDTFANRTVTNAEFEGPFDLDLSLLKNGENVIAAEVHQTNANSSDIVFGLFVGISRPIDDPTQSVPVYYTLDGSDPRLEGGEISPAAVLYDSPIQISNSTRVRARAKNGDEWSAIDEANFIKQSTQGDLAFIRENLRVTEVMYNPALGSEFEYIEFFNVNETDSIALGSLAFTDGIDFRFSPNDVLPPQTYGLLTSAMDPSQLAQLRETYRLDDDALFFGPYSGRLSNSGEHVELRDQTADAQIVQFEYDDEGLWPIAADGAGHSLTPIAAASLDQMNKMLEYAGNWQASAFIGGSPAAGDSPIQPGIQLSEFLALSLEGDEDGDWIELVNASSEPISLSGYYLSDDDSDLKKWAVPTQQLGAGAFKVFTQADDFGAKGETGFGLGKDGERLYLSYEPDVAGVGRVVDAVRFQAQQPGETYGRVSGGGDWASLGPSAMEPNPARAPQLSISEFMFHPSDAQNASTSDFGEYVEIYNPTNETAPLWNERGPFRIRGGVDFDLPMGVELAPKQALVIVGFDPSIQVLKQAFLETYGAGGVDSVMAGPFQGLLANNSERIRLEKPQTFAQPDEFLAWVLIDETTYFDRAPWPMDADGSGLSLHRTKFSESGNTPVAWSAKTPSPGSVVDEVGIELWSLY